MERQDLRPSQAAASIVGTASALGGLGAGRRGSRDLVRTRKEATLDCKRGPGELSVKSEWTVEREGLVHL